MTTRKKQAEDNLKGQADGLALSDKEKADARKEGAKEDAKEAAKDAHHYLTDGSLPGDAPVDRWAGSDEIQQWADTLDLGLDTFQARIAEKGGDDVFVPENKVAGLLKLERAGQNRTPYVKALMKRLGVKSVYEVTDAGPPHTNDLTSVSDL